VTQLSSFGIVGGTPTDKLTAFSLLLPYLSALILVHVAVARSFITCMSLALSSSCCLFVLIISASLYLHSDFAWDAQELGSWME
jgi:hypothetical protein